MGFESVNWLGFGKEGVLFGPYSWTGLRRRTKGIRIWLVWWWTRILRGRWCRGRRHGGESLGWPFLLGLVLLGCVLVFFISIHKGEQGSLRTLFKLKGTCLGRIPMRGLTARVHFIGNGQSLLERVTPM